MYWHLCTHRFIFRWTREYKVTCRVLGERPNSCVSPLVATWDEVKTTFGNVNKGMCLSLSSSHLNYSSHCVCPTLWEMVLLFLFIRFLYWFVFLHVSWSDDAAENLKFTPVQQIFYSDSKGYQEILSFPSKTNCTWALLTWTRLKFWFTKMTHTL